MVMRRKVVRLGGRRGREIGVERTSRKGPPRVAGRAAALDHGHPPHRSDAPRSTPLRRAVSWARPSPRSLYRELLAANHNSTVMRGCRTCARWQSWAWAARPRVKTVCAPWGARGPGAGSGLKRRRHHGCAVAAQTGSRRCRHQPRAAAGPAAKWPSGAVCRRGPRARSHQGAIPPWECIRRRATVDASSAPRAPSGWGSPAVPGQFNRAFPVRDSCTLRLHRTAVFTQASIHLSTTCYTIEATGNAHADSSLYPVNGHLRNRSFGG